MIRGLLRPINKLFESDKAPEDGAGNGRGKLTPYRPEGALGAFREKGIMSDESSSLPAYS
jgi:hypothetical protein